jgi:hypothetical protein
MPRAPIPAFLSGSPYAQNYNQGSDDIANMIYQSGSGTANAEAASGQIWGNTIANLGQQIGGVIMERSQQKQMAKRDQAWVSFVQSGQWRQNPEQAYAYAMKVWGPQEGPKQFQGLAAAGRLSGQKEPNPEQDRKDLGAVIGAMDRMTPEARAAMYPQAKALASRVLPQAQLPDQYDDQQWTQTYSPVGASLRGDKPEKRTPQIVPGPNGGKMAKTFTEDELAAGVPLYSEPKAAPRLPAEDAYIKAKFGDNPTPEQLLQGRAQFSAAGRDPRMPEGAQNDVKDAVTAMKEGTVPPQLPGRASKEYVAIMAESKRQGYNLAEAATDWTATQKHIATLNGSQQTRMAQAIDNASESLDVIDTLASQWKAGRFPLLNKAQLAAAKGGALGPQAQAIATKLEAQISDVTSELGNVYMGGNSPTDHALGLASKNLSADWSENTLKEMTNLARTNLKIRRNSMRNVGVAGASDNNPYAPKPEGGAAPKVGDKKTFANGRTAVFDGKGWLAQ